MGVREGDPEELDTYTYKLLSYFDALPPGTYNYACTKHEESSPTNISQSPSSTSTEVVVCESERYPSIIPYRVLPKPELLKRIETFTELEKQFYTSPIERVFKLYRSKKISKQQYEGEQARVRETFNKRKREFSEANNVSLTELEKYPRIHQK